TRLREEVQIGEYGARAASLDATIVLLQLYEHHDLEAFGGVDPRTGIYRRWVPAKNSHGEAVTRLRDTGAWLHEIQGEDIVYLPFAREALHYVQDETERNTRFLHAFQNLKRLGLVHEVTQIWDGDPTGTNGRRSKPLYTLYIHDAYAKENDPSLHR